MLATTKSGVLVEAAALIDDASTLIHLRAEAADEDTFLNEVKGLVGAGWDQAAHVKASTAKGAAADAAAKDLVKQRKAIGLVGNNDVRINWQDPAAISGDADTNEQASLTSGLTALLAGSDNANDKDGNKILERRIAHDNRSGHLPGARGVIAYMEYGITPPTGVGWPAKRRLVADTTKPDRSDWPIYYTWTHYGDDGTPAFVRIQ
jgi:hypothetical protein